MIVVRKFEEGDWPILKQIRLKALKSDPAVFGSSYQKESQMTDDEWRGWLTNADTGCFGIFDGDQIVGMTCISIHRDDPTKKSAILWGSWLEPHYRGQGISEKMYQARLEWARNHPTCERITVSHRAINTRSFGANQKHGFVYTHTERKIWPDGLEDDDLFYELRL